MVTTKKTNKQRAVFLFLLLFAYRRVYVPNSKKKREHKKTLKCQMMNNEEKWTRWCNCCLIYTRVCPHIHRHLFKTQQ